MINVTTINEMYIVSVNNNVIGEVFSFINKETIIERVEEALADNATDISVNKRGIVSWDVE